ncbi:MAG TPA: AI-2E family transporter [Rubrobacteraceae bacterium]|nr:AI-2E family transporter [Rubrobacteraceae bacterium]
MQDRGQTGGYGRERTLYLGVALVLALLLGGYLVYRLAPIVLVLLLTLLFSIIISGPVGYLERRGIIRSVATLIVLGAIGLALYLAGMVIASTVETQARELSERLPTLLREIRVLASRLQESFGIDLGLDELRPNLIFDRIKGFLSGDTVAVAADIGGSIANGLSLAFVAFIATIYLVLNPKPLVNGFVSFFPAGSRQRVREILREMYHAVQRWFLGQLTSMTLIGVLSAIALSIIGIDFAVLIGLVSGLISFIPFVGPVISVIPPVLLALVSHPINAVWVVLAYAGIQLVESNLIQPVVMSRAVSLHPATIVFALLIMGTLFGFVGLLLAVPLVAALHVLVRELWIERMDRHGTDPDPPPKEDTVGVDPPKQRARRARRMLRAARDLLRRS